MCTGPWLWDLRLATGFPNKSPSRNRYVPYISVTETGNRESRLFPLVTLRFGSVFVLVSCCLLEEASGGGSPPKRARQRCLCAALSVSGQGWLRLFRKSNRVDDDDDDFTAPNRRKRREGGGRRGRKGRRDTYLLTHLTRTRTPGLKPATELCSTFTQDQWLRPFK